MIHYDVEGPHSVNWRPYKYNNLSFSPKRVFCQQNANGLQLLSPNSLPLHQILDLTTLHNHMSQFLKTNLSVCICTHPIDSLSLSNIVTSIIFTSWIHRGSCFSIISFFFSIISMASSHMTNDILVLFKAALHIDLPFISYLVWI